MNILVLAPKRIRIRMRNSEAFQHIIARKIGARVCYDLYYQCSFSYPEDTLRYFAPDIPESFPWESEIDVADRVVALVQYYEDIIEMQRFFDYALQSQVRIELYSFNKEDYYEDYGQKEQIRGWSVLN